jgi:protein tyrosine phosphatase (PTP) superfamily phosphohydrolase (DUF442 family)
MPNVPHPQIRHLRAVDDQLIFGAQPTAADYVGLAEQGVRIVIDLRTGTTADPRLDDVEFLGSLGIEYVSLPLTDGHAPSPELLEEFFAAVEGSPGRVYVHCAAGVGRTTSVEMAYRSRFGLEHSVIQQLAVGPPTIEQIWFVAGLRNGQPTKVPALVAMASRALDAPRHAVGWVRAVAAKTTSRKRSAAR